MHAKERELERLLEEHGFELQRGHKHLVYRNPAGLVLTMSNSPSDINARNQALRDLQKMLGMRPGVAIVGSRREKRRKSCPIKIDFTRIETNVISHRPSLADQLEKVRAELKLEGKTETGRTPTQPELQINQPHQERRYFAEVTVCREIFDIILRAGDEGMSIMLKDESSHRVQFVRRPTATQKRGSK